MDIEHCRWHIPPPNFHQPHRPRFLRACLVPLPFHSTFPPSPPSSWQYAPPAALRSQTVVSVDEGKVKRQLIVCSTGFTPNVEFFPDISPSTNFGKLLFTNLYNVQYIYIYIILPATSPRAPLLTPSCGLHPKPIVALLLPPCGPQKNLAFLGKMRPTRVFGTRHDVRSNTFHNKTRLKGSVWGVVSIKRKGPVQVVWFKYV